jgi:hypothetical protein
MALAHPGSLLVDIQLADGLYHRTEPVRGLPGAEQFALGALLPLLHPVELCDLVRRPFLVRLLKALLVSLSGETLFDVHGGETSSHCVRSFCRA